MKKNARWSEADLRKLMPTKVTQQPAIKQVAIKTTSIATPTTSDLNSDAKTALMNKLNAAPSSNQVNGEINARCKKPVKESAINNSEKRKEAKKSRLNRVIDSIKSAHLSGTFNRGEFIELRFDGAMLLSPNELYALNPFLRIGYRKAWHDAIHWATLSVTKGQKNFTMFDCFEVGFFRQSTRLCDTDALSGYAKAPIDGLRYAGLIKDDHPQYFKQFSSLKQQCGTPLVILRIDRVCDSKPVLAKDS